MHYTQPAVNLHTRVATLLLLCPGSIVLGQEIEAHDISGPAGVKYDRIELVDLDGDQDLDVLTCEERHQGKGLGVIWYENPLQ